MYILYAKTLFIYWLHPSIRMCGNNDYILLGSAYNLEHIGSISIESNTTVNFNNKTQNDMNVIHKII